ncbi:acrylyl-CoA reductase family protein [Paenibacillus aceti]|uniref:Quinone oxidoreductase YhfP n=1 Tax=Paenibacillus aceti TaxID=1820010 RepID=A0ABQ1VTA7_9BACL|nr:acryloyl-CoA reductase [Paenibacillus aceti]GGF97487.1 putative quinone oxidoreductase YhfP [Paenibacillus aceti]
MEQGYRAYRVHHDEQGFRTGIEEIHLADLPEGDVTIRVHYSSVNYKDGLASIADGKIVRSYPITPGIDLAGEVMESRDSRYQPGDLVLCTGYGLGVSQDGGLADVARVPGDWLVRVPQGLSLLETMAIGTAGFTAALSVERLIGNGITPDSGSVLVLGSSGGVGSLAVAILGKLGYHVIAVTGKPQAHDKLRALGAAEVIGRGEAMSGGKGVLAKERWAAVVDPVGGAITAEVLKQVKYGGSVAISGLTGGSKIDTTVFPFILRGVNLLGIDSVFCPMPLRQKLWQQLAGAWKPETALAEGVTELPLERVPEALSTVLAGQAVGRQVIKLIK